MKIGILTLMQINADALDYANPQNVGLARAFAQLGHDIVVYSCENSKGSSVKSTMIRSNLELKQLPVQALGNNAYNVTKFLDKNHDVMVCFSDIQLAFIEVFNWCRKNSIKLYPYVGVIKSRQDNVIKRLIVDALGKRNIRLYKGQTVFAKTHKVQEELTEVGVDSVLATVGLDTNSLHEIQTKEQIQILRTELGFSKNEKIVMFVARMVSEKRPLALLEIFSKLMKTDPSFKLCVVGKGELSTKFDNRIKELGIENNLHWLESVPNNQMWKYYSISSYYVNLNVGEIFGMAILEAMYYKCAVVARRAPGPEIIINDKVDGYLCSTDEEILLSILNVQNPNVPEKAHQKIIDHFTWDNTAIIMENNF